MPALPAPCAPVADDIFPVDVVGSDIVAGAFAVDEVADGVAAGTVLSPTTFVTVFICVNGDCVCS